MSRRKQNNPRAFKELHGSDLAGSLKRKLPATTEHAQISDEPLHVNSGREKSSPPCDNGRGVAVTVAASTKDGGTGVNNNSDGGFHQDTLQVCSTDADAGNIEKRIKRWEASGTSSDAMGREGKGGSSQCLTPATVTGELAKKGEITLEIESDRDRPRGGEAGVNHRVNVGDSSTAKLAASAQSEDAACLFPGREGGGQTRPGGNTTCLRCDIQFCHLKNFLVHKRFYCESRHGNRDKDGGGGGKQPDKEAAAEHGRGKQQTTVPGHRQGKGAECSNGKRTAEEATAADGGKPGGAPSSTADQPLDLSLKKHPVAQEAVAAPAAGSEVGCTRPLQLPGQRMLSSGCLHVCMWCGIAFSRLESLTAHQTFYCPAMLAVKQQKPPPPPPPPPPRQQNLRPPAAPVVLAHDCQNGGGRDRPTPRLSPPPPDQARGGISACQNSVPQKPALGLAVASPPPLLNGAVSAVAAATAATFPPAALYSCEHCRISFKRLESLVAHETFYCAGRELGSKVPAAVEEGNQGALSVVKEETVGSKLFRDHLQDTRAHATAKASSDAIPAESIEPAHQPVKNKTLVKLKHCKSCDISFNSLSNFITHKKFYCSSQGPKVQNK